MQFYLALSEDGQTKILGTQADAKAVNKDFQPIDIPTDKPGLMAWIQQMLDETLNAQPTTEPTSVENLPIQEPIETAQPEMRVNGALPEEPKHLGNRAAIKEGTVCSICARTPKGVKIMEQVFNSMDIAWAINLMEDETRLNTIIGQVEARKRELEKRGQING